MMCQSSNKITSILFTILILFMMANNRGTAQTFDYLPGDVNMYYGIWPPEAIGGDVTYLVNYFRGVNGAEPCSFNSFFASADANGDCLVVGGDVTYLVNYFRGISDLDYCSTHEPSWGSVDDLPDVMPTGWPACEETSDNPPVLESIGSRYVYIDSLLEFDITASDPDGGTPSLYAYQLPGNASFVDNNDGTGTFDWTPAVADTGSYEVLFVASDGVLADSEIVEITVRDSVGSGAIIANHTFCDAADEDWLQIPSALIDSIMANYEMYYIHTSHGSQIISGCAKVNTEEGFPDFGDNITEGSGHVGEDGDTTWAPTFRSYLNAHPDINLASISWCWEHRYYTEEETQMYLDKMNELENDYPNVVFVYQTGRRYSPEGDPELNHRRHNNQIRDYCEANGKVLFDFADIESYDPDGNYYDDDSDACDWCDEWCSDSEHDCSDDCTCAHSHCFNCWQKGRTWWVMLAILEGWTGVQ